MNDVAASAPRVESTLRRLELDVFRRLDGLLQGDHLGLVPAPGSEAGESREYQVGDDVRRMDWAVTARTMVPHVRDTIADRELETWIVVDRSASLDFGTAEFEKRDLALAMVAAVGFLTSRAGNRVGVLVLGNDRTFFVPARAGREAMLALLHQVDAVPRPHVARPPADDLRSALRTAARLARRRGLVVVISDFLTDSDWQPALRALSVRHDVLAVEVLDPREVELPPVGLVTLVDTETGRRVEVQTASERVRARYAEAAAAQRARIAQDIRGAGSEHVVLRTDRDWLLDLAKYVITRQAPAHRAGGTGAMSFLAAPRLLLLLFVAGLAIAYLLVQRQRRQYAVRFTNVNLLASVAPHRPGWRRHLAAACLLLALVLIVMAFARPARAVQVPRETATVMLAIDVSQSMRATDVHPTRIRAAQRAVRAFVDSLPTRFRLGLVSFAGNAQVLVPPTHERRLVRGAVASLQLQQQTAIGEGIFASIGAIENSPLDKGKRPPARIVLLSDGATNAGRPNAEAVAAAKKKGVRVSTIAFGTESGTVVVQDEVVPVPADRDALRKIADDTGGRFASAATEKDLRKTYEDLGSRLAEVTRKREVTPWFVGAALLFAFAAAGASLVWTSRLP